MFLGDGVLRPLVDVAHDMSQLDVLCPTGRTEGNDVVHRHLGRFRDAQGETVDRMAKPIQFVTVKTLLFALRFGHLKLWAADVSCSAAQFVIRVSYLISVFFTATEAQ